jgi:tRNA U54 and U55 pseudouridine synthase Pus10
MSVYRITEFKTLDIDKVVNFCETLRNDFAAAGAESMDVVLVGDGKGYVVAKYATQALMEAAANMNKQAFGKMIVAGLVNAGSIGERSGEVVFSF